MPLTIHASPQKLEADVLAVLRAIPAESFPAPVHEWVVSFGTDSTGDEAFFVRAVLDVDEIPPEAMGDLSGTVLEAVDRSGVLPGAWTYLSLRTVGNPGTDAPR